MNESNYSNHSITDNSSWYNGSSSSIGDSANANWTIIPVVGVVVCAGTLLTNGLMLTIFATNRQLWTPFNVYLINLTLTNFVYALLQNPPDIINNLHLSWPLNFDYCTVYIYASNFLQAGMYYSHMLITIDRVWSITSPASYRNNRSVKTSLIACSVMWIFIHIFIIPGFVLDMLYYRLPLDSNGCFINADAQWNWALSIQIVIYNLPVVIIVAAYPLIWYKKRQRQKLTQTSRVVPLSFTTANQANRDADGGSNAHHADTGRRIKRSSTGFLVLTMLTLSIIVCWTPISTYYTIELFTPLDMPVFYKTATILFSVESVLDPIWFTIAIRELREAQMKILCVTGTKL